ncbi:MAG TPA: hypothetical protein VG890_14895 [Puia sp.]|nr:hypothetical protein [Puia sp.]
MKRIIPVLFVVLFSLMVQSSKAQCSICTRTAQQLGEKPARGLNTGIIYLAFTPLAIGGFIGLRWWRRVRHEEMQIRQEERQVDDR